MWSEVGDPILLEPSSVLASMPSLVRKSPTHYMSREKNDDFAAFTLSPALLVWCRTWAKF